MEEIKFTGIITLEDKEAREWLQVLQTKIDTINDRTKKHTIEIKEIEKIIKEDKWNEKSTIRIKSGRIKEKSN